MTSALPATWHEANQRYSMAVLAEVRSALKTLLAEAGGAAPVSPETPPGMPDSAIETLCRAFDLSAFESKILIMCAGVEWDSHFSALCAAAQGDTLRGRPTFSLALAAFADAHWSALSPERPLRCWRLVRVSAGDSLTTAPLRIDERILHYLAGVPCLDEELRPLLQAVPAPEWLPQSQRAIAAEIAAMRSRAIVQLCGDDRASKRAVAAAAFAQMGLALQGISAHHLPQSASELDIFRCLWEREAVLSGAGLLVECDDAESGPVEDATGWIMERFRGALAISARAPRRCPHRPQALFEVRKPTSAEQEEIWRGALDPALPGLKGDVRTLVSQFSLGPMDICSVAGEASIAGEQDLRARLWDGCRMHSRPRLEGLAQRIEAGATWDDLVLPDKQRGMLAHISTHVRRRAQVYEDWGFAKRNARGLGISALFAGPSGTGKTMAAEVLANDLRLDLYRIDLSQIVNKYIGETEKNLARVFDAADEGAAILLFDEADALFGKRSEVKDSHDRYANIEVSYLLQRMEAYRGLAILTTNRKSALDQAFLRRIRFVVDFPFPETAQRLEIWRRAFPPSTPTEGLRFDRLARLSASGAHIRNISLGAAFLAAEAGEPVRMSHLLSAARSEFEKLEKPVTDAEVAGWL